MGQKMVGEDLHGFLVPGNTDRVVFMNFRCCDSLESSLNLVFSIIELFFEPTNIIIFLLLLLVMSFSYCLL